MDNTDSLEGWVSVRENPFFDKCDTKKRLLFYVAWNTLEGKITITCRDPKSTELDSQGWAGAFTFRELQAIHEQLTLVHPSLTPHIPQLPLEPRGLWAYITHTEPPDDEICNQIHEYLELALDVCGHTLLISTLFEEHTYEEYFENISALKRRVYDEAVAVAEDQLQNILFLRSGSVNMLDMCEVYKQEDEVLYKWNVAMAELYNYLIQPFLDMREMALNKVREAKNGLTNPNLGERPKAEYAVMFSEWQENYVHALDRIQELYIEYYSSTVEMLDAAKQRMLEDQEQFGKMTFNLTGLDRLYRISEDLCLDKLQLHQNRRKHCENQRDKDKQEMVSLMEKPGGIQRELEALEESVYDWQVKVHEHHLAVLSEEERLLRMHIKSLKQEQLDEENEVFFYDAVEDTDELSSDEESPSSSKRNPRLHCLNQKLATLFRKRAQIRNKKRALTRGREQKTKIKSDEEQMMRTHHSIQLKREENRALQDKKSTFIDEERRKTMERLRQYKMKYPSASTIRPQCRPKSAKSKKSDGARRKTTKQKPPKDVDRTSVDRTDAPEVMSKLNDINPSMLPPPPISLDFSPIPLPLDVPPPPELPPPQLAPPPPAPPSFAPPPPPPPPSFAPPPSSSASSSIPVPIATAQQTGVKVAVAQGETRELVSSEILREARSILTKRERTPEVARPKQVTDPLADMMDIIRQGVKLRPMNCANNNSSSTPKQQPVATPAERHTQQLKEAFMRISARLQLSDGDDDDDSNYGADFGDSDS